MERSAPVTLRIDRLLVYLRFARTRSAARQMVERHTLRRNRNRVRRASENVCIGDVLTLMVGGKVRVIEVLSLPEKRVSSTLAQTHFRELDRVEPGPKAPTSAR
ncbi:MAG: S4 domain-containing protein [Pseudomonadota bacterium]